ncbi:MAG: GtrA family protein, partial [Oscillospiraceae bacterium]|nr:GtrA family protein [Oscillospiraceae bacterium]
NRSDLIGAITADGDGQHLAKDIYNCGEAMLSNEDALIMGCRNFDLPFVPPKSKKGNKITSFIFRAGCGITLSDTQTGLRAASTKLFPALLEIGGDRYEYETNMLLELYSQGVRFTEVEIETVYEDNNSGSHFHPVRDSVRIYKLIVKHIFKKLYRFFKYLLSSGASAVIDLLAFWLIHMLLSAPLGELAVGVSTAIARIISSFFNFNVNKKMVFGAGGNYGKAMARYYILCVVQLCASAVLVWLLGRLFSAHASWLYTLLKAVVDTLLFFVSYQIQQKWVFKDK